MNWNGHAAAVSITLDDGLPCHLRYALPALDKRGVKATFFVVCQPDHTPVFPAVAWRSAIESGHEVGSHSVTHPLLNDCSPEKAIREVVDSKTFLQTKLQTRILSYAYPHTRINNYARAAAGAVYLQARGHCPIDSGAEYVTKAPDWYYTPAISVNPDTINSLPAIFDQAVARNAWVTLICHGIGPDNTQHGNITGHRFGRLLDHLLVRDIWIAPYGTVAAYLRAVAR